MKLLAFASLVVCVATTTVGVTLGGTEGFLLSLCSCIVALFLIARVLAPSRWDLAPPGPERDERRFLATLALQGFLLRGLVTLLLHSSGNYWQFFGGDEGTFDKSAQVFSLWVQGALPFNLTTPMAAKAEVAYPYMLGCLYYTFGWSKVLPLLLNCAVGATLVYPVHALAGRLAGRVAARRAAMLVTWFPSIVLWSALMVRDVWILLFLVSALYYADRLRRERSLAGLAGLVLCLAGVATTRHYMFVVAAAAIGAGLFLSMLSAPRAILLGGLAVVAVVFFLRGEAAAALDEAGDSFAYVANLRNLNALGVGGLEARGSLGSADISTPTRALAYLPEGLLYFFFSPLPWQISSPRQAASVVDLLVWYSLMPAIVTGLFWAVRRRLRAILPLLLAVVGISVLYALMEGNIGIIFRHRAQIIVPLCAVAGVGYALKRRAARKESRLLDRPLPVHAAPLGALRPAPGVRLPARA